MLRLVLLCSLAQAPAWPLPEPLLGRRWRFVGNHRYEIRVPASVAPRAAYAVTLPWRRSDPSPELKGTVLLDAISDQPVGRCRRLNASGEAGRFAFSGVPGGVYHLYYMPFETCELIGGACQYGQDDGVEAMVQYAAFAGSCNDTAWWAASEVAEVTAGAQESRTEFDAFQPMEVAATASEVMQLQRGAGKILLVTETRSNPIRMRRHLPSSWSSRSPGSLSRFHGAAQPGEAYVFQIGLVFAEDAVVESASLAQPLRLSDNASIPTGALKCMNLEGIDFWGRGFKVTKIVPAGEVYALWMRLDVPVDASSGSYKGTVVVNTSIGSAPAHLEIDVRGAALHDHGYADLWRGARLAWFDSTLGNNGEVPPPFVPLSGWRNRTVRMLDKEVSISPEGMLESIKVGGVEALAGPVQFEVLRGGKPLAFSGTTSFREDGDLVHSWFVNASAAGSGVRLEVAGSVDATGYLDFEVKLAASSPHEVRLLIPSQPDNAVYAAGLGRSGGFLRRWVNGSAPALWRWDGINHNSAVWVGSTRAGVRVYPRGDDPLWQAMVPLDSDAAPPTPDSWSNSGAGGIRVFANGTIEVFTGPRGAGEVTYLFSLMATPARPLDLPKHFSERYAQLSRPANYTQLRDGGATVVNLHQGNVLNPWINYPYLTNALIKGAADECHALGMKFKLYNTMRELSNRAMELDAMRTWNETFVWRDGVGGGGDWLREHLHGGYSVAWATPIEPSGFFSQQIDQAIKVKALSRWNNYYVEGLRQLAEDTGFDGIYLDEIAYDRVTMLRAKAVLGGERLIDHHSDRGQFAKAPAMVYAEAFPFIDSLWYGEGFDYDGGTPDFWLVEISGIPWGLNSDLLRYPGMTPFHFRGMLFGNANRWQVPKGNLSDAFDPRAVWALWDSFGIATSRMYGWWLADEVGVDHAPVTVNSTDVKCTVFVKKGDAALIVLASFGPEQAITLFFDWGALGLSSGDVHLRAPVLQPMQPEARVWSVGDGILVPAPTTGSTTSREGWILLLEQKPAGAATVFV